MISRNIYSFLLFLILSGLAAGERKRNATFESLLNDANGVGLVVYSPEKDDTLKVEVIRANPPFKAEDVALISRLSGRLERMPVEHRRHYTRALILITVDKTASEGRLVTKEYWISNGRVKHNGSYVDLSKIPLFKEHLKKLRD